MELFSRDKGILIKAYDFQIFLESTYEVQQWKADNLYLDLWALCQHYGFATPMIDASFEIAVAAYFATHSFDWRINDYVCKKSGIGTIRCRVGSMNPDSEIRPIGRQPFDRPGQQDGVAIWIDENRDLANESYVIKFKFASLVRSKICEAARPMRVVPALDGYLL